MPAFTLGLCAAYSQVTRPPQQKAGDREFARVALARGLGEGNGRVEIAHHLCVGNLGDHLLEDGLVVRQLGDVALPRVKLHRDRHVALLGEPPAHILDVLVHAKDLLHDQNDWKRATRRRHRPVGRNAPVRRLDFDLAGGKAIGIRGNHGLGAHRLHRDRKPAGETRRQHLPA